VKMSIESGSIPSGTAPFRADPLKMLPPAKSTLVPVFSGLTGFPVMFGPMRSKSRAQITGAPLPALFTVLADGSLGEGPLLEHATIVQRRIVTATPLPFFGDSCFTRPPYARSSYTSM
jgi:hypothetical protein